MTLEEKKERIKHLLELRENLQKKDLKLTRKKTEELINLMDKVYSTKSVI